ncbi:MAG: aromatic amino acid hydroxylase [Bdellovibrionales bacterium]|nr:aromatic amino acid hydroxylase [Bdellovibrionales bacterium]
MAQASQPAPTIPHHLKKYVVDQNYERYTPEDQATWRYIMRRLIDFLSQHAHPCYVSGLEKTGITAEEIPQIEEIDQKLRAFGWSAVPVSGFIPPAAFMEFQSLGILPIASDMRTLEHLLYTPAPDIVHEAAGHAPILIDPGFARYLKRYAELASKAIISKEDMEQYEAIRILSDLKEDPASSPAQIAEATQHLDEATRAITYLSEAAFLGRMNWWTAEYGLIGSLDRPKIFGAGLLSSVGESKDCLQPKVTKIPLTLHCLDYAYDITEPQPQLFVTPNFETLELVLDELAERMAFRQGGLIGLEKARKAKTVNTIELDTGLQISGQLDEVLVRQIAGLEEPVFLRLQGPVQLCWSGHQLAGHGTSYHQHGYSSPLGRLKNEAHCLSKMSNEELQRLGVVEGRRADLLFASGIAVSGTVQTLLRQQGKLIVITFTDCRVTDGTKVLFDPSWGAFDLAVGTQVTSVFGGPADRPAFGNLDDFVAKRVPVRKISPERLQKFEFYQALRLLRHSDSPETSRAKQLVELVQHYQRSFAAEWLMGVELLEMAHRLKLKDLCRALEQHLLTNAPIKPDERECVTEGIRLAPNL